MKLPTYLLTVGLFSLAISCDKEENFVTAGETTAHPAHLVFSSAKELQVAISTPLEAVIRPPIHPNANQPFVSYQDVYRMAENELSETERAGKLSLSLQEIQDRYAVTVTTENDGSISFDPIVRAPRLSNLLNEHRVIQIGNDVIQFEEHETITVEYDDVIDLANLRTSPNARIKLREGVQTLAKGERLLEGICTFNYHWDGKDQRLKPRWYSQTSKTGGIDIKELWIEVKHQRKGFLNAWYANKEDEISVVGVVEFYASPFDPQNTDILNEFAFNTADVIVDIHGGATNPGDPTYWFLTGSSVLHTSRDDGNQSRSCRISK